MTDADCIAGWCADTEWCAVGCAADLLGRKWHPHIVAHLAADGSLRFSELRRRLDGVAKTTLSDSLSDLTRKGLVERRVVGHAPRRVEYVLTERGEGFTDVLGATVTWEREHAPRSACE